MVTNSYRTSFELLGKNSSISASILHCRGLRTLLHCAVSFHHRELKAQYPQRPGSILVWRGVNRASTMARFSLRNCDKLADLPMHCLQNLVQIVGPFFVALVWVLIAGVVWAWSVVSDCIALHSNQPSFETSPSSSRSAGQTICATSVITRARCVMVLRRGLSQAGSMVMCGCCLNALVC